jgi:hypothetical protein
MIKKLGNKNLIPKIVDLSRHLKGLKRELLSFFNLLEF